MASTKATDTINTTHINNNNNITTTEPTEWKRDEPDFTKPEDEFVKKKLIYHLQRRPARQQLVNLNILKAFDQDPSLRAVMDNLMKQRLRMLLSSRILDKKLSNRKSIQSLIREGILKEADGDVEEEEDEKGNRRDMYRRMSNHSLTEFLSQRPTLQELVKANMVQDVMTWTKIACQGTIPRERNCHQMCLSRDDSSLYVLGGFNTGSVSIDLLKFDIENQKWSRPLVGGPVPPERYCHSVVNIDSNLVVFGGFSVEGKWLNDLHALDTEYAMNSEFKAFVPRLSAYGQCKASTNNSQMLLWYPPETTGEPPSPRAAHAACVVGKRMYVFGGNNYNKLFNDLHCLDTSNMKWSRVMTQGIAPSPRANHSLTAIGDKYLIVFGGNDGQPLNDIHIFDIEKSAWQQPKINGTPPLARGGHSAVCIKNKQLLIFAGGYNSKILNDLHIFDVETMTWIRPSDTGMIPEPRAGHSCCVTKNNVVYVCGGGDSENDKLFNDLYQLDTGYFTTDEKQISKLIYRNSNNKDSHHHHVHNHDEDHSNHGIMSTNPSSSISATSSSRMNSSHFGHSMDHQNGPHGQHDMHDLSQSMTSPPTWTMSRSSYEYFNGNFRQSTFQNHVQNFINNHQELESPLMKAGVISDDIANISQEIDVIIQSVENGIKNKITEFKNKEQGYIMILRSIEAERTKLIDDVNRDITMLKYSVKESLDNLQQKFIAKMLRQHVDYINNSDSESNQSSQNSQDFRDQRQDTSQTQNQSENHIQKSKPKTRSKSKTMVTSPLTKPSLSVIEEEKEESKTAAKVDTAPAPISLNDETKEQSVQNVSNPNTANNPNNDNNENVSNNQSQSPHPPNSQSPNPTQHALQQQQMGLAAKSKTNARINAALTQQAQFQKHQMMARIFVKEQEKHRQQQVQQMAQQAQQIYNQQQQHPPSAQSQHGWWQKNAPFSIYNYGQQQPSPPNGQPSRRHKKKRRKKKKRGNKQNNNNNQQQQQQQQQQNNTKQTQQPKQAQKQPIEGNLNNINIPNLLNNNVFNNNGINNPLNNTLNTTLNNALNNPLNNTLTNGLTNGLNNTLNNNLGNNLNPTLHHNGINNGIHKQYQPFNPPPPPFTPNTPNTNPMSTLNPNAVSFKQ